MLSPIQKKEKIFEFVPEVKAELMRHITIIFDNIANVKADAIVNDTNPQLKHNLLFGVNGEIHTACKEKRDELIERLKTLHTSNSGDFAFGSVVWTPTYGPLADNSKCINSIYISYKYFSLRYPTCRCSNRQKKFENNNST